MRKPSSRTTQAAAAVGGGDGGGGASSSSAAAVAANNNNNNKVTPCCNKIGLKRGPWTPEEDELLANYIKREGEGRWRTLPKKAGLLRCGKSCRLRWMNYLRPSVKRGHIAPDEEDLILRLHRLLGNRWSLIAGRIPGRTDNEIKNYWNTHLSKKLISQGIDPRTHKPLPIQQPPPPPPPPITSINSPIIQNSNILPNQIQVPTTSNSNYIPNNNSLLEFDQVPALNYQTCLTQLVDHENGNMDNNNNISMIQNGAAAAVGVGGGAGESCYEGQISNEDDQEQDDMNYCTNDDVFSSFLNSLINEDVFNSQNHLVQLHQQHHHQPHQQHSMINVVDQNNDHHHLISSSSSSTQAFAFGPAAGWDHHHASQNMIMAANPTAAFHHHHQNDHQVEKPHF